ncbi:unnamed protein product [Lactuca saligna]|uniref:Uncharacterized protein n=1 Tax=Lactuca saligna TaxID=75948 RepID=A0AA35ZNG5_LACSI|nr:unnamed protein product [Lactuca saligna]
MLLLQNSFMVNPSPSSQDSAYAKSHHYHEKIFQPSTVLPLLNRTTTLITSSTTCLFHTATVEPPAHQRITNTYSHRSPPLKIIATPLGDLHYTKSIYICLPSSFMVTNFQFAVMVIFKLFILFFVHYVIGACLETRPMPVDWEIT